MMNFAAALHCVDGGQKVYDHSGDYLLKYDGVVRAFARQGWPYSPLMVLTWQYELFTLENPCTGQT